MRNQLAIGVGTLILGAMAVSSSVDAGTISVDNFDFSDVAGVSFAGICPVTGCVFSVAAVPGWINTTGSAGQIEWGSNYGPTPTAISTAGPYVNYTPTPVTAYSNGGALYQDVGTAIAGDTYSLSVMVGDRKDYPEHSLVELIIGEAGSFASYTSVILTPTAAVTPGNWVDYTGSLTALPIQAKSPIRIYLDATGAQGDWTDVQLSYSTPSVPEPSTWVMLALGFGGLGSVSRARRRSAAVADGAV